MSGYREREPVRHREQATIPRDLPPGHTIAEACGAWLAAAGLTSTGVLAQVEACWTEVVGTEVAAHVRPRSLHEGELVVGVDHPGWATEMAFLSDGILQSLERHLGNPVARRLKVTVQS